jgi:hypothetical protein
MPDFLTRRNGKDAAKSIRDTAIRLHAHQLFEIVRLAFGFELVGPLLGRRELNVLGEGMPQRAFASSR